MLFGNANVIDAIRKKFGELVEAGARGHGGSDGDDTLVVLRFLDQRFGKNRSV
ncbi:hypothetical protein D3C71_2178600 [compost metagenome]